MLQPPAVTRARVRVVVHGCATAVRERQRQRRLPLRHGVRRATHVARPMMRRVAVAGATRALRC
eukprot:5000035-Prymnesium_polylepis.1